MAELGKVPRRAWKWLWWILGISLAVWIVLGWAPRKAKELKQEQQQAASPMATQVVGGVEYHGDPVDLSDAPVPSRQIIPLKVGIKTGIILPVSDFVLDPEKGKTAIIHPPKGRPIEVRRGKINPTVDIKNVERWGLFAVEAKDKDMNFFIILRPRKEAVNKK